MKKNVVCNTVFSDGLLGKMCRFFKGLSSFAVVTAALMFAGCNMELGDENLRASLNGGVNQQTVTDTDDGFSISFWVDENYDSDWTQVIDVCNAATVDDATNIYFIGLSLINHWIDGSQANFLMESQGTASNGGAWNSFVATKAYATISFNTDGSITYYKDGKLIFTYAADTELTLGDGASAKSQTVSEMCSEIISFAGQYGYIKAYEGLSDIVTGSAVDAAGAAELAKTAGVTDSSSSSSSSEGSTTTVTVVKTNLPVTETSPSSATTYFTDLSEVITSSTGLSISFKIDSNYESDWTQIVQANDGTDVYFVGLSLINHYIDDSQANVLYESQGTASNGGVWNSFVGTSAYGTISFNTDGSIKYYKNGALIFTYAASTAMTVGSGASAKDETVSQMCSDIISYVSKNGLYVAYNGLTNLTVNKALTDTEAELYYYLNNTSSYTSASVAAAEAEEKIVELVKSLVNAGVSASDLLAAGVSASDLVAAGASASVVMPAYWKKLTGQTELNAFYTVTAAASSTLASTDNLTVGFARDGGVTYNLLLATITDSSSTDTVKVSSSTEINVGFTNDPTACSANIVTGGGDFTIYAIADFTNVSCTAVFGPWNSVIQSTTNPGTYGWVARPDYFGYDPLPNYPTVSYSGTSNNPGGNQYDGCYALFKIEGTTSAITITVYSASAAE